MKPVEQALQWLKTEDDRALVTDGVLSRLADLLARLDDSEEIEFRCALVDRYRLVLERIGSAVAAKKLVEWTRSTSAASRSRTMRTKEESARRQLVKLSTTGILN